MNQFYIYVHSRATDGQIFYVGKGRGPRASKVYGRNPHWKRIVAKHEYAVTIVRGNLTESEALAEEVRLIAEIGRENLCNMTDGGEGTSGHTHKEETKRKQSDSAKRVVRSAERLAKLKVLNVGRTPSEETRQRMSESKIGRKHSLAAIEKMRQKALVRTPETIAKQVAANTGQIRSAEARVNMAASQKGKLVECSNGMMFAKITHASEWLKENGHPKASVQAIIKANSAKHRVAYGFGWKIIEGFCQSAPTL